MRHCGTQYSTEIGFAWVLGTQRYSEQGVERGQHHTGLRALCAMCKDTIDSLKLTLLNPKACVCSGTSEQGAYWERDSFFRAFVGSRATVMPLARDATASSGVW